jgi:hypothetical protein
MADLDESVLIDSIYGRQKLSRGFSGKKSKKILKCQDLALRLCEC